MKREDQQDETIRCLLLTSVSTCFGHHYAHLQENKGSVTAFGVLFWFCWMWLVAVVGRCVVGCEQMFIINFCLNMFRASLCPSSGEQTLCYCIWCVVLVLLDVVGSG
jgi:glycerol-3-phosphate acyltransferase PlsY